MKGKKVLITPLDWGLGHASRCVRLIQELLKLECEVMIGASGDSLMLLKEEFPSLKYFDFPSYAPVYSASSSLIWKMTEQLFKFIKTINREHKLTEKIVQDEKIELVISDNRYGCWSRWVKSIFITHQVTILVPQQVQWLSGIINYLNHHQIKNFDECWVPDFENHRLAGRLSYSDKIKSRYIGPLSRFELINETLDKVYDILIVLSGPEPQRTILEEKMIDTFKESGLKACLVRGVPGKSNKRTGNLSIFDFLDSQTLQSVMRQSDLIISRSGYSTVMDLSVVGGKVVFIPTPGQPEQEYLAQYLKEKKIAFTMPQPAFNLNEMLKETQHYAGFQPAENDYRYLHKALRDIMGME
jgi:uncharacterized protein (TIGR00661 family)